MEEDDKTLEEVIEKSTEIPETKQKPKRDIIRYGYYSNYFGVWVPDRVNVF